MECGTVRTRCISNNKQGSTYSTPVSPIALLIKQQVKFSQLETTNLFDRDVNLIKSRQVEENAFKYILLD